jgi:hypothetical protein
MAQIQDPRLGPRVLARDREVGFAVVAEPKLDQLPVALVAAGPKRTSISLARTL